LRRDIGTESCGRPAILWLVDAPESRFVLEENLEWKSYLFGFFFGFRDD
jgi:hypothetical protein